jgi:tape measure domain-containing protein
VAQANVKLSVDATGAIRSLQGVQNRTNKLQSSFNGLRNAIAVSGIALVGRQAVRTSANFDKLNVRLGLLTKQNGTFARSQQIAADAQKAFGLSATEALEGITDITARLAPLNVGVEDIKSTFFGFNTAAKLAGASTIEASNAFRQLAQALGSGRLAGDEFRSISEQIPTLLAPIAKELNVPIGSLKELAAQGKLTSDVVLRALRKIERDGGASLKELIANDPTQIFKNFSNATEDLSRAFGTQLRPVVEEVTKLLTELITQVTRFVNSPIGKAAFILTSIALAGKGVAAILPAVALGLQKVAFAGGLATVALNALPFVAIASAIGFVTTAIIAFIDKQKEKTRLITEGGKAELKAAIESLKAERAKVASQRRGTGLQQERLDKLDEEIEKLRERLRLLNKSNQEQEEAEDKIKKQEEAAEKLKEKFMEIGKAIEEGLVQNLTDAVMGTKTLAEAAISVLNQLKRKLIEVAIQQAVSGFGNFLGNALGSIFSGRPAGAMKVSADSLALGKAASQATGIPMNLPKGSFGITKREKGGPVNAGGSFLVGEKGPEMFVPSRSGTIIPNNAMGGVTNNIVVNVDASGTAVQGDDANASQFGEQLAAAIQAEIINQKRSGGLLN